MRRYRHVLNNFPRRHVKLWTSGPEIESVAETKLRKAVENPD